MKLHQLCQKIGVTYNGDDIEIKGINTLKEATSDELSFLDNPKYISDLADTKAAAVLVSAKAAAKVPKNSIALIDDEPYLKLALATAFFAPMPMKENGKEASIGKDCKIDKSVSLGKDVNIGDRVTIMPGCVIGDDVTIKSDTLIYPNVTVYYGCEIGRFCIIHAGSVIGSDGFGFAHTKDGKHVKFYQLGNVIIEDDVEIGANCAIDRGALSATIIKTGTKIDNLVQIGHNCEIGEYSLIAGQTGLSGSTKLGRNVVMGGQSASAGHLKIGAFATIAGRGGVSKSIEGKKVYGGFPLMEHRQWLKMNAILSKMMKDKK